MAFPRWLAAVWLQGFGWATCRRLTFAKYRIDFGGRERYIEQELRRTIKEAQRVSHAVMNN